MSSLERTDFYPAVRAPARRRRALSARWLELAPIADALVLAFAAFAERLGGAGSAAQPVGWFFLFPPLTIAFLAAARFYRPRLRMELFDDMRTIAGATAIGAMTVITLSVLLGGHANLAAAGVRLWLFSTVYLIASRIGLISSRVAEGRSGEGARTLIVGAGQIGRTLAARLTDHPEIGLRPVGFLDKEPLDRDGLTGESPALPVLGASWDLRAVVEREEIEHVVFTFSKAPHNVLLRMVEECAQLGARVTVVPRLFEKTPHSVTIDHIGGLSLLSIDPTNPRGWTFRVKYALDRVIAAAALIVIGPIFGAIAAAVYASLGAPIFFRQERVGRDGIPFPMLKFRTMRDASGPQPDLPELPPDTAPGGIEGEDRRSRVGAFLRRTSLDELPQLINVVRGQMSLVGPRPERPEFAARFSENVYRYGERHRVKSGITGWAQVHGLRGNTSLADRAEWDNYYIENASLGLDLRILLKTVLAVIRPRNAV